MTVPRRTRLLGDTAVVVDTAGTHEAHRLAASAVTASWEGVEDVVVGQDTVTVVLDPRITDPREIASLLAVLELGQHQEERRRLVEIPTAFDGPDLAEIAALCDSDPAEVVDDLTRTTLEAAFLGFAPGFAYLSGLPDRLARVPRRGDPRPVVEPGSVAVGGGFAAVYPWRSPGGWHLIGRTDLRLFDPETPPYSAILPGDLVRLVPSEQVKNPPAPPARTLLHSTAARRVEVVRPGLMSLVEDAGRRGFARLGVPRAGAADSVSSRLANRLAGNDDGAGTIEVTGSGPTLRVSASAHVAVVGDVELRIEETSVPCNCVLPLEAGQSLRVGAVRRGLRAYVAFDGGVEMPKVFGSRSSDVLCGLGCGPLREGDLLALGDRSRPRGRLLGTPPSLAGNRETRLRVISGPELLDEGQLFVFESTTWQVGADSDRVGVRLSGAELHPSVEGIPSRGTVTGAVQVPAGGSPIVLLCDHATLGGYPVVATVIAADASILGQLRPGDRLGFVVVEMPEARAALVDSERLVSRQVSGWYPQPHA